MKTNVLIIFLLTILPVSQGCSIYKAANAPPPIPVEEIKPGKDRNSIISILGMPKSTETTANNERTDLHEFTAGYDAGGKIRIILYIAGDIFTLGLAELIFWPIEIAALQGDEGRAVVSYDQNNIAKNVLVTTKGGTPWAAGSATQPQAEPTSESGYEYRKAK